MSFKSIVFLQLFILSLVYLNTVQGGGEEETTTTTTTKPTPASSASKFSGNFPTCLIFTVFSLPLATTLVWKLTQ
ncbi:unnamed protein product [Trichobilharzia szidati]|nr:unnamed protein product [Trichobilharzia szidati]